MVHVVEYTETRCFIEYIELDCYRKERFENPLMVAISRADEVCNRMSNHDPHAEQEWRDSIRAVIDTLGQEEAAKLLHATIDEANGNDVDIEVVTTPYRNTISPEEQGTYPGDLNMEQQIHNVVRWNAMMMVTKANKDVDGCLLYTSPSPRD